MRPMEPAKPLVDQSTRQIEFEECRREADAAERRAARTYNVVDYAEHLEVAALWRRRAAAIEKGLPGEG